MPAAQPTQSQDTHEKPKPILRWATPLGNGQYETTVLLFQGRGDYLQGFIHLNGEKRQVLAHMNQRTPDPSTGEVKPNFFTLSEPHGQGDETKWTQIGYGNAINHRKDGKDVFFDEVLFNVNGATLRARVTEHAGRELHRQMGFTSERLQRPAYVPRQDAPPTQSAAPAGRLDNADSPSTSESARRDDALGASPGEAAPNEQRVGTDTKPSTNDQIDQGSMPSESSSAANEEQSSAGGTEDASAKKADASAGKEEPAGAKKSRRRKSVTTH